jgi:polysaccharide biosynthesis transport protein
MVNMPAAPQQANDSINVLSLWRTLRKRRFLAIGVAVSVFGVVAAYTWYQTPIYESETLILVDNRKEVPLVQENGGYSGTSATAAKLETEIQILKSRSLVGKALKQLPPPYNGLPVEGVTDNLFINQLGEAGVLRVAYRDVIPARSKAILTVLGDIYVTYSLESTRSQSTNAIKFIEAKLPSAKKELDNASIAVREFRKRYDVPNPDAFAENVATSQQGLQQRIQDLEITISQNQSQYNELASQVGEEPDIALATTILSQDPTYLKLVSQYKELEEEYASKISQGFKDSYPTVGRLKDKRNEALRLLQDQAISVLGPAKVTKLGLGKGGTVTVLGTNSSTAGSTKINAPVRQEVQQNLTTQMLALKATLAAEKTQLESLRKAQAVTAKRFNEIPQLQQQYTELQRRLQLSSKSYDSFVAKLEELRISEAQEISPWKVLEPPFLPTKPISPKVEQNLLYGLLAGLLLGIGAAFVPDLLDERIKGVEEAKELTGLPLLGAVPKTENLMEAMLAPSKEGVMVGERLVTRQYTRSPFKESLRSLALSLRYLGSNNSVKTLLLTSSIPAEGKSLITYNLGLVLSEFGRKVLIVDGDMRKPSMHRFNELPNTRGLSTAIATDTPWRQLVQSGGNPNLTLLTTGPMPPNPVALLTSERMTELLQEWREAYDYVLIDTPPIVGLPDAQSLVSLVDQVVLVVGIERTTRSVLARVLEILKASQCKVAGIVVNLLNDGNEGYYYQYYTSYYTPTAEEAANGNPGRNARKNRGLLGLFRK